MDDSDLQALRLALRQNDLLQLDISIIDPQYAEQMIQEDGVDQAIQLLQKFRLCKR